MSDVSQELKQSDYEIEQRKSYEKKCLEILLSGLPISEDMDIIEQATAPLADKLHEEWQADYRNGNVKKGKDSMSPRWKPEPKGFAPVDQQLTVLMKRYPDGKKDGVEVWRDNSGVYEININALPNSELTRVNKYKNDNAARGVVEIVSDYLKTHKNDLKFTFKNWKSSEATSLLAPQPFLEDCANAVHQAWAIRELWQIRAVLDKDNSPRANDLRASIGAFDKKQIIAKELVDLVFSYVAQRKDKTGLALFVPYEELSEEQKNKDRSHVVLALDSLNKAVTRKSLDDVLSKLELSGGRS